MSDKTEEQTELEERLQVVTKEISVILQEKRKSEEPLTMKVTEQRRINDRLQQIKADEIEKEQRAKYAPCLGLKAQKKTTKKGVGLQEELNAVKSENDRMKRQLTNITEELNSSKSENSKLNALLNAKNEQLKMNLTDVHVLQNNLLQISRLSKNVMCQRDKILYYLKLTIETHSRELNELLSQTKETEEPKKEAPTRDRQQHQRTAGKQQHGKYMYFGV